MAALVFQGVPCVVSSVLLIWSVGALATMRFLPTWFAVTAAVAWLALAGVLWWRLRVRRGSAAICIGCFLIMLAFFSQEPRNDRDWESCQSVVPRITRAGDTVTIDNFRHATYRTADDYDVEWLSKTYDLRDLEGVEYLVVRFSPRPGVAHTMLSFRFSGERYVAVSVEVRREKGRSFSPLLGLYRNFELMYVIGDERDLLGLRAAIKQDRIQCYPIKATPDQVRRAFVSVLQRAEELRTRPEFYNTGTNSCCTNLLWHLNEVRVHDVPWQVNVALPGFSDRLVYDLGLIDCKGTLEEARKEFTLPDVTADSLTRDDWSTYVRRKIEETSAR